MKIFNKESTVDFIVEIITIFLMIMTLGFSTAYIAGSSGLPWAIGSLAAFIVFSIMKMGHRILDKLEEIEKRLDKKV